MEKDEKVLEIISEYPKLIDMFVLWRTLFRWANTKEIIFRKGMFENE